MSISRRWHSELFVEQHVTYAPQLYKQLFSEIWGYPHYFKEFLITSDVSTKLEYSKKIFAYFQSTSDVFLPSDFFKNLINSQTDLISSSQQHIPQDHVIHSVNLYILGIYLFFNYSTFHQILLKKTCQTDTIYQQVRTFIKKWRVASLCHDLGYVFENGHFTDELISSYRGIYDSLINHFVTRGIARLVACTAIPNRSSLIFRKSDMHYLVNADIRCNGIVAKYDQLLSDLAPFDEAVAVNDPYWELSLSNFPPQISANCLVISYNEQDIPEFLAIFQDGASPKIYYDSASPCNYQNILLDLSFLLTRQKSKYRYYIPFPVKQIETIFRVSSINSLNCYSSLFKAFPNYLPSKYSILLEHITDDIHFEEFIFKFSHFLNLPNGAHLSSKEISSYYNTIAKGLICSRLDQHFKADLQNLNVTNWPKEFLTFLKKLENDESFLDSIIQSANVQYNTHEGNTIDLESLRNTAIYCLKAILKQYVNPSLNSDKNIALSEIFAPYSFFKTTWNNKITLQPFLCKLRQFSKDSFEVQFLKRLEQHALNLNLSLKEICSYHPDHSNYDHGIISAYLLSQAVIFSHYLLSAQSDIPFISFAWHNLRYSEIRNEEKYIEIYSDAIFAILLHNIYVKSTTAPFGLEYKHSLNMESFSYFLSFCDNIQKWSRPKQNNPAYIDLPKNYYAEDQFDVLIADGHIILMCSSDSADSLKSDLATAESFLPGITKLVRVTDSSPL